MSQTFYWCKDKTKLAIWNKQVFCVTKYGNKFWYFNGQPHRVNGPAPEYHNGCGDRHWWLNGKRHRENGPAVESVNGDKVWWLRGDLHRENGPAVERVNGIKHWWLNGGHYSEFAYWRKLKRLKK